MSSEYDAVLVVGFGGPEGKEDVMPFLENVLRGRNVPRERMLEVAEHYNHFGGVSPINQQVRDLLAVLEPELKRRDIDIPVYWGNRNWTPMLNDTMQQMTNDGVKKAIALVLAGYSSYSSCRQYRENIYAAQDHVGEGAPHVDKIRVFFNHPLFAKVNAENVQKAIDQLSKDVQADCQVVFTAHSIPNSMADNCRYEAQLQEASRLVAEQLNLPAERWQLVYQSRSGRPQDPWLEPDVCDHIEDLGSKGVKSVVIMPIGFLSDHMEVMFDLDEEAKVKCDELGIEMARASSAGVHPEFVEMLGELIEERVKATPTRRAIGEMPANHDVCPIDCCPAPVRPAGRPSGRPQ